MDNIANYAISTVIIAHVFKGLYNDLFGDRMEAILDFEKVIALLLLELVWL